MEALIQCILRMPAAIKKSSINSFTDSPFVDVIALVKMPRMFSFPNMKHYDDTTYPDDHIATMSRRASSRLRGERTLYKELTKYPYKKIKDVLAKAWAQIKWEEDEVNYTPSRHNINDERRSRRVERKSAERRPESYPTNSGNDRTCDNRIPRDRPPHQPERTRARVPEYNLNITPVEAVAVMKNLGNSMKWLGRMSSPTDKRDSTKWYDVHRDHAHRTENCIALKFEVVEFLKRGHLKEHLTNKGKNTLARRDERQVKHNTPNPNPP
ncbi:hypothetical protein ACOSP7_013337 [Xanthoceras sorbifolium]